MPIYDVESESHFFELIKHDKCVIDFFATWGGPCKTLGKNLDKVLEEYPDVTIIKVDINLFDNIANIFNVQEIPHLVFFHKEKLQNKILKSSDYNDLIKTMDTIYKVK